LDYEFNGFSGDAVLENFSPNDPAGQYNATVSAPEDSFSILANQLYFDQYGLHNFGTPSGFDCCWAGPESFVLGTPYTSTLGAFTTLVVWAHYPATVTNAAGTTIVPTPSGETVLAKGADLAISRNGSTASSWNASILGRTVASGLACTDGTFCAVVVRRDSSNNVTVYRSNSIGASLPLTPDAGPTIVSGAFSNAALAFGGASNSLIGIIAEGLVWSRALSDAELIREMGVVRRAMAVRGVTIE
jgi:hypothetical protein